VPPTVAAAVLMAAPTPVKMAVKTVVVILKSLTASAALFVLDAVLHMVMPAALRVLPHVLVLVKVSAVCSLPLNRAKLCSRSRRYIGYAMVVGTYGLFGVNAAYTHSGYKHHSEVMPVFSM